MHKYLIYIIFFISTASFCQNTVEVGCAGQTNFDHRNLKYYVDEGEVLSIHEIINNENILFKNTPNICPLRFNLRKAHWFMLEFKLDEPCVEHQIFELEDFRFQKGELYLPTSSNNYIKNDFGYLYDFDQKSYKHKNFVFDIQVKDTNTYKIYFKINSNQLAEIRGNFRNGNTFIASALNEYFYLALFYGVVISLFLYNLFIFFYLKDITYLHYTLYIAAAGLWSLCNDGLGFQYIWSEYPSANKHLLPISNLFMIIFLAYYTKRFFNMYNKLPFFSKLIDYLLIARCLPYLFWFFDIGLFQQFYSKYFIFDTSIILVLLIVGIIKFNKQRQAKLYVAGFTSLVLGYIAYTLDYFGIIEYGQYTLYAINFGMALNMIFITVSLVSRLRSLIYEAELANRQILYNLKEKELLKDELNKQLEVKVLQRTQELMEKNEELNSFIYRASHDIKGPISSLMGLAKIGQLEDNAFKLKEYFKHVLDSSEKLDKTLNDLLQLSHVNGIDIRNEETDINILVNEFFKSNQFNIKYKNITVETSILKEKVRIDQRMVKPILQNLIENSLKYHDPEKEIPLIKINVYEENNNLIINVWDNGIGIPKEYQEKVFEKFFRVGVRGSGTGLGLHIVQRCAEKLGGTVTLDSEIRKGTSVTVEIPLQK